MPWVLVRKWKTMCIMRCLIFLKKKGKNFAFLLLIAILLPVQFCLHKYFGYCYLHVGNVADNILACFAMLSFVIALMEYVDYKKKVRATTFTEYNKRYTEDENVIAVTKYLICILENHQQAPNLAEEPSIYQKEMFLRFFEELDYQMQNGRLKKDDVLDFFAYYAVAAAMIPEFIEGTELKDKESKIWHHYRHFVKEYEHLSNGISYDYANNRIKEKGIQKIKIELY